MKIELTIKVDYLQSWGAYEGVRELVQNGKDAETEFSAAFTVRHRKDTDTLVLENEGCTIPHEALLFGHTSKSSRSDTIGKFGEGLKLGMLALVRAGHEVKIRSGSEVWVPKIERSEKFSADVLVVYIEKGRAEKDRVQIEVSKISADDWSSMKDCFLFLTKSPDQIETNYGTLLLGDKFSGKLYVKGIFVESDPKYRQGYNFTGDNVSIDRDRKMIQRWDIEWRTREIWSNALRTKPNLIAQFFELLEGDSSDLTGIDESSAQNFPKEVIAEACTRFSNQHGATAVAVQNLAESQDIEHLGRRGIIVNKPLRSVLQAQMGNAEKLKQTLKNEVTKFYGWGELTSEEQQYLSRALLLIDRVVPLNLSHVDVVDFRSATIAGLFVPDSQRVQISKRSLTDQRETLVTLVHEVAHRKGNDGSHDHMAQVEHIWGGIVVQFLRPDVWDHITSEEDL